MNEVGMGRRPLVAMVAGWFAVVLAVAAITFVVVDRAGRGVGRASAAETVAVVATAVPQGSASHPDADTDALGDAGALDVVAQDHRARTDPPSADPRAHDARAGVDPDAARGRVADGVVHHRRRHRRRDLRGVADLARLDPPARRLALREGVRARWARGGVQDRRARGRDPRVVPGRGPDPRGDLTAGRRPMATGPARARGGDPDARRHPKHCADGWFHTATRVQG